MALFLFLIFHALSFELNFSFNRRIPLTLPLPRGGGGGGSATSKGFSSITFQQNKLETSNFAWCNFHNIQIGKYDQI